MNFSIVGGSVFTLTLVMAGLWWLSKNSPRKRVIDRVVEVSEGDEPNKAETETASAESDEESGYTPPAEYDSIVDELWKNRPLLFGDTPNVSEHQQGQIITFIANLLNPYKHIMPDMLVELYQVQVTKVKPEYFRNLKKFDENSDMSGCTEIGYSIHSDNYIITGDIVGQIPRAVVCLINARDRIGYVGDLFYA